MALFFSRRAYNPRKKKFSDNPASVTRYVSIDQQSPDGRIRKGSIISRDKWHDLVINDGGSNDVLIYVHGFNTSQLDMLSRLDLIKNGVRANGFTGTVIAYDWPSDGQLLSYGRDRADAKKTAPYLVEDGILPLLELPHKPRVHLIAHSMGALVVLRAFSDFGDSAGGNSHNWSADQVTFVAADIDAKWLDKGAWGSLVLKQRSTRFTNYYSGRDEVLAFSGGLISGGRARAGHVGMRAPREATQWDIYGNEQYLRTVPVHDRNQIHSHRWWFENDGFYRDLSLTLEGHAADAMPTRRTTNIDDLALLSV